MSFEGCGASEWAQWAFGANDAGVGEVAGGLQCPVLTTGSSSGKTQLKVWLGIWKKNIEVQEQIIVASHIYRTVLPCKAFDAKGTTIQNGR
jgi:hypothetical protein